MAMNASKHILVISEYWLPEEWGGGERSAAALCAGLVRQGMAVTVLTSASKRAPIEEDQDGVRVLRILRGGTPMTFLGNIGRLGFGRSALRAAISFCKKNKADAVNKVDAIHLMNTSTVPLAQALARSTGVPVSAHCNSPILFCPKGDRMRYGKECGIVCSKSEFVPCLAKSAGIGKMGNPWWLRDNPLAWWYLWRRHMSYRDALPAVTRWAAIGTGLSRLLTKHGVPSSAITLLPNPVDTAALETLPLPRPKKVLRVGYMGSLTIFKGVQVLADAAESLPLELHIAGDGPLEDSLKHRRNVVLHGKVNDIAAFYRQVDVVVIPSIWPEGFGRVAVEAMAAGRAVIASDNGGLRDIIKGCKGGVLLPAGDGYALRGALAQLCHTPALCVTRGKQCRAFVKGKYAPDAIAKRFARFFD